MTRDELLQRIQTMEIELKAIRAALIAPKVKRSKRRKPDYSKIYDRELAKL